MQRVKRSLTKKHLNFTNILTEADNKWTIKFRFQTFFFFLTGGGSKIGCGH